MTVREKTGKDVGHQPSLELMLDRGRRPIQLNQHTSLLLEFFRSSAVFGKTTVNQLKVQMAAAALRRTFQNKAGRLSFRRNDLIAPRSQPGAKREAERRLDEGDGGPGDGASGRGNRGRRLERGRAGPEPPPVRILREKLARRF